MAKLIRKTQKVFGQDGATDQFAVFGTMKKVGEGQTPTYSKDIETIQSNAAYSQGWQDAVIANYAPFMEELNAICYSLTYQMSYLLQNGVPEWDDGTTYYINSIVVGSNSLLYRCLTDNCLNVDPTTDDGTNWYNYSLYGANQDLSNLTTAGIDKLHALKGYLDSGKLLSDPQLFEAVYSYNHSTFDLSKFTVTGSPTITDDGIASGFSSNNYIQKVNAPELSTAKTWEIGIPLIFTSLLSSTGILYQIDLNTNNHKINLNADGTLFVAIADSLGTRIFSYSSSVLSLNTNHYIKIRYDASSGYFLSIDGTETKISSLTTHCGATSSYPLTIGYAITSGSIDLKQLSITVDGYPVFNGNKTGIDRIKPADYTVVGTPTISVDGIAVTNALYDYVVTPIKGSDLINKNWVIEGKVVNDGNFATGAFNRFINLVYNYSYTSFGSIFAYVGASQQITAIGFQAKCGDSLDSTGDGSKINYSITKQKNEWKYLRYRLEYNSSTKTYTMYHAFDSEIFTLTGTYTPPTADGNLYIWNTQTDKYIACCDSYFAHDLNSFKIYVNGDLVYQPCLLIPYNESSTGSKIVDVAYRDRVVDVFEQYGSANYYTIDEVNQNATLPMGEVYGFIEQKTSTDFDNVTQTAKNTSISWGMPDWSRAISKTVYTEYTATERGWINAEGKSADKKVGLTINSNTVAAAEATGSSDESCFACLVPIDIGDVYNTFKTGTNVQDEVTSIQFIPCKGEA